MTEGGGRLTQRLGSFAGRGKARKGGGRRRRPRGERSSVRVLDTKGPLTHTTSLRTSPLLHKLLQLLRVLHPDTKQWSRDSKLVLVYRNMRLQ